MVGRTHGARRLATAVAAVAAVTLLAACSGSVDSPATDNVAAGSSSSSSSSSSPSPTPTPAELTISPAEDATGVLPTEPVVVKATTGTLGEVTVTDAKGRKVAGALGDGRLLDLQRAARAQRGIHRHRHGDRPRRHAVDHHLDLHDAQAQGHRHLRHPQLR